MNQQTMERVIVRRFVNDVLASGRSITVSLEGGYDYDTSRAVGSTDQAVIMAEAFAGDEAHLFVHDPNTTPVIDGQINCIGWVFIVLGNEGWDVISDYTTNLEELGLMSGAEAESDRYCEMEEAR